MIHACKYNVLNFFLQNIKSAQLMYTQKALDNLPSCLMVTNTQWLIKVLIQRDIHE